MSIVIKWMDVPKCCDDCQLRAFDLMSGMNCVFLGESVVNQTYAKNRHKDCPLIALPQKHGRLIDADELMKVIEANDYMLRSYFNTTDRGMFTIGIKQAIDEAPTIIEAEDGE